MRRCPNQVQMQEAHRKTCGKPGVIVEPRKIGGKNDLECGTRLGNPGIGRYVGALRFVAQIQREERLVELDILRAETLKFAQDLRINGQKPLQGIKLMPASRWSRQLFRRMVRAASRSSSLSCQNQRKWWPGTELNRRHKDFQSFKTAFQEIPQFPRKKA